MSTKDTAQTIVNIFETSTVRGRYGQVTLLDGDSGMLTFGRSQTTLGSGNLYTLLDIYCANKQSIYQDRISRYLPALKKRDELLNYDLRLHNLLRASADDPVMLQVQDEFFDKYYWQPSQKQSKKYGIKTALGSTVIYDSIIHGSWPYIRNRTNKEHGPIEELGERKWISTYTSVRHDWLAHHRKPILRKTIYRQDSFLDMIKMELWDLSLPIVVRGLEISAISLAADPIDCFSGPAPGTRDIRLSSPLQHGFDVRQLQLGLSEAGLDVKADGWFGAGTEVVSPAR